MNKADSKRLEAIKKWILKSSGISEMKDIVWLFSYIKEREKQIEVELTASQEAQNSLAALYDKTIIEREELKNRIKEQKKEIIKLRGSNDI